jgi:hypothetical protein
VHDPTPGTRDHDRSPLQDGRFLLLDAVGRGGMAAVYRAFDRMEQRIVALKVLGDGERAGPANPLSAEYEAWSLLRHRNVVRAYELAVARHGPFPANRPYMVLEHVRGGPVHRLLRPGRIAASHLEALSVQLLHALRHVHDCGLVHRDLKPANVLLRADPPRTIKLTDFGLATRSGSSEPPGVVNGSLPYLAPESLLGGSIDGRSDLYGMGILLYQLATGELPGPCGRIDDLLCWHLRGAPADPRRRRPRFPARLARFIRRLTCRSPDERPSGAVEALALLGSAPEARRDSPHPAVGRAELARLRLALDAARLGGRRRLSLPRAAACREVLLREARVRSEVLGLGYQRLRARPAEYSPLGRLALRLLVERGSEAPELVARYRLDELLPLDLLSGLPIWDQTRAAAAGDRSPSIGWDRVREFLLECSARRPLVLVADRTAARDAAARAVVNGLLGETEPSRPPAPGRGGLLLLTDGWPRLNPATRRGS